MITNADACYVRQHGKQHPCTYLKSYTKTDPRVQSQQIPIEQGCSLTVQNISGSGR